MYLRVVGLGSPAWLIQLGASYGTNGSALAFLKGGMVKFTVIGFYEDDSTVFCHHVEAEDSNGAVVAAVREISEKKDSASHEDLKYTAEMINIVEIIEGHVNSVNDCTSVSSAADWPDIAQ